jgi:hypothetical protein
MSRNVPGTIRACVRFMGEARPIARQATVSAKEVSDAKTLPALKRLGKQLGE